MNESKFTPGPWFSNRQRVYWKKPDKDLPRGTLPNGLICTCKSAEDWPECDAEARENANLIAAAPDMYSALEEILADLDTFPQVAPGVDHPEIFDLKLKLRKLLRKARGESEVSE